MNSEKQTPSFWAIIPATVRYDDKVCSTAKLLFAEMTALSNQEGYCWASNQYFSELFKISITQVSRLVASLENRGFIKTFVEAKKGNQRKIYPQVSVEGEIKENVGKTFEQKFDDLIGIVSEDLKEERLLFIEYWTAKNDGGKKEHWQKQKTFAMRQRWSTWKRNKKDWAKPAKLPSDERIRESVRIEESKKFETQSRIEQTKRTPKEQARVNEKLAEIRSNLKTKFAIG